MNIYTWEEIKNNPTFINLLKQTLNQEPKEVKQ